MEEKVREEKVGKLEPYLMTVLARRFVTITSEMTNTVLRTARSGVLASARDFSCAIVTPDGRLISVAEGLPIHIGAIGLAAKPVLELFDDIQPGDCFLNNSPYHGGSHHADHTFMVPVFYNGEHVFTAVVRGHQADIGNCMPTTYSPFARDIYEEGALNFPCVRVQRNYQDVKDIIRMCQMRIRVPEQWYGDFLAGVGAARIGERRLIELCDKYGVDIIKTFVDEWQDYGRRFMIDEIRKLPRVTLEGEAWHDPVPGVAPDGIPVRAKVTIDPDEGYITVDLTESGDAVPGGLNLCEATTIASVLAGLFNNFSPNIPHNDGAFSRIKMILRDGAVVGRAKHPLSASLATTDVAGRITNLIQSMFAKLGKGRGLAEGGSCCPPNTCVISGSDYRYGNRPYINQLMFGFSGGPALYGHDGWLTYCLPAVAGTINYDSIEVDELKYPIIVECDEIECDHGGAGEWDGAPGIRCLMRPRKDPGIWAYFLDSKVFSAKGVLGGHPGGPAGAWKISESGEIVNLPAVSYEVITPKEKIGGIWAGGGGYGDPLDCDPEKVRWKARNEWISLEKAHDVYGVVLDTKPEEYAVDYEATQKLRAELRKSQERPSEV